MDTNEQYIRAVQEALEDAHGLLAAISAECARNGDGTVSTKHGKVAIKIDDLRESLSAVKVLDEQVGK